MRILAETTFASWHHIFLTYTASGHKINSLRTLRLPPWGMKLFLDTAYDQMEGMYPLISAFKTFGGRCGLGGNLLMSMNLMNGMSTFIKEILMSFLILSLFYF